jgi:hypothetical protein
MLGVGNGITETRPMRTLIEAGLTTFFLRLSHVKVSKESFRYCASVHFRTKV